MGTDYPSIIPLIVSEDFHALLTIADNGLGVDRHACHKFWYKFCIMRPSRSPFFRRKKLLVNPFLCAERKRPVHLTTNSLVLEASAKTWVLASNLKTPAAQNACLPVSLALDSNPRCKSNPQQKDFPSCFLFFHLHISTCFLSFWCVLGFRQCNC